MERPNDVENNTKTFPESNRLNRIKITRSKSLLEVKIIQEGTHESEARGQSGQRRQIAPSQSSKHCGDRHRSPPKAEPRERDGFGASQGFLRRSPEEGFGSAQLLWWEGKTLAKTRFGRLNSNSAVDQLGNGAAWPVRPQHVSAHGQLNRWTGFGLPRWYFGILKRAKAGPFDSLPPVILYYLYIST